VPGAAEDRWTAGPLRPLLAEGAVHVWRADLTTLADELGELLCGEERARAQRIAGECAGKLWRRSRGLLRTLLGRYLQRPPGSLRFLAGEHGKPALVHDAERSPSARRAPSTTPTGLSFNVSHSGELALYAFSGAGAVGVDVEVARRPIDELAIAARAFGAAEARRLEGLDPTIRRREFLRAWTRHEAELKCLGVGIGGVRAGIGGAGVGIGASGSPWIAELPLGSNAAGAVAAERPARELRCWDWRG
jgi:4'-phosphopantetheinyl transferase